MNTSYIKLTIRYPREYDEDINLAIASSKATGSEVKDWQTYEDFEAQKAEWEIYDKEDWKEEVRDAVGEDYESYIIQAIYFNNDQASRQSMFKMERGFYEQFGGEVEVLNEEYVSNKNWDAEWKKHYSPLALGDNICIVPAWMEVEDKGQVQIIIDPGQAFGTGSHDTTVFCLESLEDLDLKGKSLLDLGCGSGILSIYAKLTGAEKVEACDIDEDALEATKKNASLNQVDIAIYKSDLFESVHGQYDIIIANILAEIIVQMLDGVDAYLNEDGLLILSGIIISKLAMVEEKLDQVGFEIVKQRISNDWVMIEAKRKEEG